MSDTEDAPETPADTVFVPPSVHHETILTGRSYTHTSPIPPTVTPNSTLCILGVDEAGRGPVLGPMVYAVAYAPLDVCDKTLKSYSFDDSKKLTAAFRAELMTNICDGGHELGKMLGWSVRVMSPQGISSGMLRHRGMGAYNLNAQAHDTTIQLIKDVIASGVVVKEIYIDTVGPPATYQSKLQRLFPSATVTVSKKADSLYPIVSAASVVAKTTRDACLEVSLPPPTASPTTAAPAIAAVGSGYPSDPNTVAWLKRNKDPVFGWPGSIARFSWSTTKDLLEKKGGVPVEWAEEDEEGNGNIVGYFGGGKQAGVVGGWFGRSCGVDF
ncbi:hypothetical protein BJ508DRAFT_236094 [Ascobolus immersus RN42]|uniref:Ribonuclease n=1 Tax=Ascobolus immersus RN42 TaxID=1160509 RepID=A0A3N4IHE5_ASCIM|nr:hypothetical protein BJ508DRAFT_236094 [Ascobolus immersus RN42]